MVTQQILGPFHPPIIPMAIWVVMFQRKGCKIRQIFGQKSTFSKKNYCILSSDGVLNRQKVTKPDFQNKGDPY